MKREMINALKNVYEAPSPLHKKEFIRKLEKPQLSTYSFMLQQISYIRKRVWFVSVIVLVFAIFGTRYAKQESVWMLSSMMPFVALCAVTENARSRTYGMAELERASKFSLKSVVQARIEIIGLVHFVVFGIVIPFVERSSLVSFARTGLYLLVPYLLSSTLGLWAVRKFQDVEVTYVCMGTSAIVCLFNIILKNMVSGYYEEQRFIWWLVAGIYLVFKTCSEYKKTMYQTEELIWN